MKISGFLPLKMTGRHYADNVARCDILFSSLRAFTTPDIFDRFYVVVPHDEFEAAQRYAKAWSDFPVEVVDESVHFGVFKEYMAPHQVRPWHRQQIIKLGAPALVKTEYFIVFDPDVFATRPFTIDTLLPGGRALTHMQERNREPNFWVSSSEVLKQDPKLGGEGIWWTPAILSTTICRALHKRLEEMYGMDWKRVLLERYMIDWTEYTLYWMNGEREGLIDQFHVKNTPGGADLHTDQSVWFKGVGGANLDKWDAQRYFSAESQGLFAVVQSNTGLSIDAVVGKLKPFFPITIQPYERHQSLRLKAVEFYSAVTRRVLGVMRKVFGGK